MSAWNTYCKLTLFFLLLSYSFFTSASTPFPISGRNPKYIHQIKSSDVLARVNLIAKELQALTLVLGKPLEPLPGLVVDDAQPREVFFQAVTLKEKATRLSFEITQRLDLIKNVNIGSEINMKNVFDAVDEGLRQIYKIKKKLGIKNVEREKLMPVSTTPSDVYQAITKVNRHLNLLLDQEYTPKDVFLKISLAENLLDALLSGKHSLKVEVKFPFVPQKTPDDVYKRLISCFELVKNYGDMLGIKTLYLLKPIRKRRIIPGDVYEIASLIVSELYYFASRLVPDSIEFKSRFDPVVGYKMPSDVYQLAGRFQYKLAYLYQKLSN